MKNIELKHISIIPLQTKLKIYNIQHKNQKALIDHPWIDDFQKLKTMYEKQQQFGWDVFTDDIYAEIKEVEEKLLNFNKKGYKPEIYLTNEEPQIYNYSYKKDEVDKTITGEVLLYANPLEYSPKRKKISQYSIYELRQFLSHCEPNGKNLLSRFALGFGPYESKRLVNAINFYNLQLERQSMESDYGLDDSKLFYANKDLKEQYLQDQIKEIAKYFVDTANECVWGELTDNQKQKILRSVLSKSEGAQETKQRLIDIISNYTTVREIELGLVKTKTIDRFIIK